jgi:hypothetical protein
VKVLALFEWMGLTPRVILTDPDAYKTHPQAIFCSHPHGVMSYHHALFYLEVEGSEPLSVAIPLSSRRALGARPLFAVPILRDLVLMTGAVDASAAVAAKCLTKGLSLTILPGGEHEQLLAEKDKHVIYIKSRKGFCKLAVQHNVPIIPAYCFGETSTFDTSQFMIKQRKWIAKTFFVALPLARGGSWLPWSPHRTPLTHCIGPPLLPPPRVSSKV